MEPHGYAGPAWPSLVFLASAIALVGIVIMVNKRRPGWREPLTIASVCVMVVIVSGGALQVLLHMDPARRTDAWLPGAVLVGIGTGAWMWARESGWLLAGVGAIVATVVGLWLLVPLTWTGFFGWLTNVWLVALFSAGAVCAGTSWAGRATRPAGDQSG